MTSSTLPVEICEGRCRAEVPTCGSAPGGNRTHCLSITKRAHLQRCLQGVRAVSWIRTNGETWAYALCRRVPSSARASRHLHGGEGEGRGRSLRSLPEFRLRQNSLACLSKLSPTVSNDEAMSGGSPDDVRWEGIEPSRPCGTGVTGQRAHHLLNHLEDHVL